MKIDNISGKILLGGAVFLVAGFFLYHLLTFYLPTGILLSVCYTNYHLLLYTGGVLAIIGGIVWQIRKRKLK